MADHAHPTLRRRLNLPLLTFYGLGTTIGAGIFVLVGKVAGRAGMWAPVSFVVAALLAGLSAFAFAELVSRFPRSAGEAVYVAEGFRSRALATVVGLMVVAAGIVSSATIASGAVGYLAEFVDLPPALALVCLVGLLAALCAWGIGESVTAAALFTVLEIAALLLIVWATRGNLSLAAARLDELLPPLEPGAWLAVAAGAMLAFYAFLGFEDLVNVAEEAKDAERTLPAAIFMTLGVTAVLYGLVSLGAVLTIAPAELAASDAPLAMIYERAGGEPRIIGAVAVFAVLNGALIQMIMASRVLYGMGDQRWLPDALAYVHPRTRTPLVATAVVTGLVLALALLFPLERLAEVTSAIVLVVFTLVNLSLLLIRTRETAPPAGIRTYPLWIPAAGSVVSAGFLLLQLFR